MSEGVGQVGAVGVVVARVNQRIKKPVINDFCESGVAMGDNLFFN